MPDLHPRTLSQLINETFRLLIRHPLRLPAIAATAPLAVHAAASLVGLAHLPVGHRPDSLWALLKPSALYLSASVLIASLAISPLVGGAMVHAVSEGILDRKLSIRRACRAVARRAVVLITASLLYSGMLFAIASTTWLCVRLLSVIGLRLHHPVPWIFIASGTAAALYVSVRWMFTHQAVLIERAGPVGALVRSADLVSGNAGRALGLMLSLWGITLVITLVSGAFPGPVYVLGQALSALINAVCITLFYYDLRVRRERYTHTDLERELDTGAPGRDIRRPVQRPTPF